VLEAPLIWLGVPSKKSRARSTFARNAEVQRHFKIEEQALLRDDFAQRRIFPPQRAKLA
jgi:hypothetical protein